MEEELLKCFVCQSKSQSKYQSADGSSSGKRRKSKISEIHKNLDSSTWKIFCHYFYPPPLVSRLDSSASSSPKSRDNAKQNEDCSQIPVFCEVCYQTISNLCNLHSQLELIQRQISKIVAQVSVAFVQEENFHDHERRCDDNVIYSMRRCIRQRYQPVVPLTRAKLDVSKQKYGDSSSCENKDLEPAEFSPLSIRSHDDGDDLNSYSDLDAKPPQTIKQEADLKNSKGDKSILSNNQDLPVDKKKLRKSRKTYKITEKSDVEKSEDEEGSASDWSKSGNQDSSESESDSNSGDAQVKSDKNTKLVSGKKKLVRGPRNIKKDPKVGENIWEYGSKWRYERKQDEDGKFRLYCHSCKYRALMRCDIVRHISRIHVVNGRKVKKGPHVIKKDPEVGENIYEYEGKWRYERKQDDDGQLRLCCLTCGESFSHLRHLIIDHIKLRHISELPKREMTQKVDENNFIYCGGYSFSRVTEPNGVFFKCGACGTLRKTAHNIKNHIKTVHKEPKKLVCELCGYGCSINFQLMRHKEQRHSDERTFVCELCGKAFKTKKYLRYHLKLHDAPEQLTCEDCGMDFKFKASLTVHLKKTGHMKVDLLDPPPERQEVEEEAPFALKTCSKCNKSWVKEESLQKHLAKCTAGIKFPCEMCGGKFLRLDIHQKRNCKFRDKFNVVNQQDSLEGANMDMDTDTDVQAMPLSAVEAEMEESTEIS